MVNCSSAAVRQNELIPLLLCPTVFSHSSFHSTSSFLPFLRSSRFKTHHCKFILVDHPPYLYFSNSVNLSAFICFPLIKRFRKKSNIGQEIAMSRRWLIRDGLTQTHTTYTSLANTHLYDRSPDTSPYVIKEERRPPLMLSICWYIIQYIQRRDIVACVCASLFVWKIGRKHEKEEEWENNVLWAESLTFPVSLVAASPQARKCGIRRRQAWKRAVEMMRGMENWVRKEGILYSEIPLCRCTSLKVMDAFYSWNL